MNKVKISAAAVMASAMIAAPVAAGSPGQLQGGPNTYVVRNVTQNGSYGSSLSSVKCGDVVKYSVELRNNNFGSLNNINVKATLGSTSNMTATPDSGAEYGTSGTATVALASGQTLAYNSGSTQLYDKNGAVVKTLSDGITAGGINVGSLGGSTYEFVNFTAKVNCPVTPETPQTPITPETPSTPAAPEQPAALPQTGGAEAGLAGVAGTGVMGYAIAQYRRSRKALADKFLNR